MCGLLGVIGKSGIAPENMPAIASRLRHRGPDDCGIWHDQNVHLLLAHNRLSVLDLSPAAHQPMLSSSGRYVLVYNGEIYNFPTLRKHLEQQGKCFKSNSDTEVLLEAIDSWGLEQTLATINGMFAFALWDRQGRCLTLVRDRLGIKPLYYGWSPLGFQFASELKGILINERIKLQINPLAVELFFQYGYIPWPYCIFEGLYKLPPGTYLKLPYESLSSRPEKYTGYPEEKEQLAPRGYWRLAQGPCRTSTITSSLDTIKQLDLLLEDSVKMHLVADVPVGAFLSGGIDSSLIVSKMSQLIPGKVKTFSVGFTESKYDESMYAEKVAKTLRTDHHALRVSSGDAFEILFKMPRIYDEPFADSSQLPTYFVSYFARKSVTVCLSGDGGDELFGGYPRYLWAYRLWRLIGWLPRSVRDTVAALLMRVPPGPVNYLFSLTAFLQPESLQSFKDAGEKLSRLAVSLKAASYKQMYSRLNRHWLEYHQLLKGTDVDFYRGLSELRDGDEDGDDWLNTVSGLDITTYLVEDILHKVDRASMAHALEVRVPLLDYRIVEFSRRVPPCLKVRNGETKWLLRELLSMTVPREVFSRPKMGFGVPIGEWLRKAFPSLVDELVDDEYPPQVSSLIDMSIVRKAWRQHKTGERNWEYPLWDVIMFLLWYKEWSSNVKVSSCPA